LGDLDFGTDFCGSQTSLKVEGTYELLIRNFLPDGLLDYFDLIAIDQEKEQMIISLEEHNILPINYQGQPFHSKGFLPPVLIEDFPIRGNKVLLRIKRRRWEHQHSGEIITRDWQLVQKGTKMTADFAAFLKQAFS
jgi:hypothetical protein